MAQADQELRLSHTIHFGLLPQAWIYENPAAQPLILEPQQLPEPVSFAGRMKLWGHDIRVNQTMEDLLFTVLWQKEETAPSLLLKVQLLDEAGNIWQQLETELLNEVYFFPQHWADSEIPQVTYRLELPPGMPPGTYSVALTLVDQNTGGQLPVYSEQQSGGVVYDAGAMYLDFPLQNLDPQRLEMAAVSDGAWLDGKLRLLGIAEYSSIVQAGGEVHLELIWQADGELPAGLQLAFMLEGADPVILPLSSFDTAEWTPGAVLRQKYTFAVPGDLPAGDYLLTAALLESDGRELAGPPAPIGQVQVDAVERTFTLPEDIETPLEVHFEPGIVLRGVSPAVITAVPGETVPLTLYWQTDSQTAEPVTAFVHLLDESGADHGPV